MLNSGIIIFLALVVCSAMAATPSMTRDRRIVRGHDATRTYIVVSLQNATCLSLTSLHWHCTSKHFCGGTLIDRKWVLTPASCLYDATNGILKNRISDIRVVLGATDLESDEEGRQMRTVKQMIIHEKFEMKNAHLKNNIALLELSSNVKITQFTQVARLTKKPFKALEDCKAMGWDFKDFKYWEKTPLDTPVTSYLQEVDMRSFDNAFCKRRFNDQVTDQEVCAVGERYVLVGPRQYSAISCAADQGGPLNCLDGVKAITSGGNCHSHAPIYNVYTLLRPYKDWIMEKTDLRNLFDN